MFKNIITRTPCKGLLDGITANPQLGKPDYKKALLQHQQYIAAINGLGLPVLVLPAVDAFPDSCFVEDVAVVTKHCAVLTNPGAPSRSGEVSYIVEAIERFYSKDKIFSISLPGTLEGGDVLIVDDTIYVGLSDRTNIEGVKQLEEIMKPFAMVVLGIELSEVLHLKTGVVYLENNTMLCAGEFMTKPDFEKYNKIEIPAEEAYAANCIWINDTVIVPEGYPKVLKAVTDAGYKTVVCDTSEYKKVDGGLSCLSLRLPV